MNKFRKLVLLLFVFCWEQMALSNCVSVVLLVVLVVGVSGFTKSCHSPDTYGESNTLKPLDANSESLVLVNSSSHGKLFNIKVGTDSQGFLTFPVVHVYGTPYEQGFAHGELLSKDVVTFINKAWRYVEGNVQSAIAPYVPRPMAHVLATQGLEKALDLEYELTVNYTSPDFYEELQGVADGSGCDYLKLRRIHMLPGLTKGHCSMFGAWGEAVPEDEQHVIQLRALDWDMDGPWGDYPAVVVYHQDEALKDGSHSWVNIGFVGWIGGLTGMSSQQMGISEIGVSYPDASYGPPEGPVPMEGTPFIVLLRDILKYDNTIDEALDRMKNAKRTEDLILGVGDAKAGYFRGVEYGPYVYDVMTPDNQLPDESWHPRLTDRVYWGMDWDCPTYNQELGELLYNNTGKITGPTTITNIMGQLQSGSNHIGIYDLTAQQLWVSFAGPSDAPEDTKAAWMRKFVHFDVPSLFEETL